MNKEETMITPLIELKPEPVPIKQIITQYALQIRKHGSKYTPEHQYPEPFHTRIIDLEEICKDDKNYVIGGVHTNDYSELCIFIAVPSTTETEYLLDSLTIDIISDHDPRINYAIYVDDTVIQRNASSNVREAFYQRVLSDLKKGHYTDSMYGVVFYPSRDETVVING